MCIYIYIFIYIYVYVHYICTVSYIPTISPFFLLKSSIFHGKSTIGRFSLEFPYFPGWFHQLIILRPGRRLSSEESFNSLVEHFGRGPKCLGVEEGWRFIRLIWYILGYNWVVPIYADIYWHNWTQLGYAVIILVKVVNLSKLLPLPKKVRFFWWTPFNFSLPKLLERFSIWNPQTCSLCVKQKARNSHNPRDGKNLTNGFPFPAGFPWISVSETSRLLALYV